MTTYEKFTHNESEMKHKILGYEQKIVLLNRQKLAGRKEKFYLFEREIVELRKKIFNENFERIKNFGLVFNLKFDCIKNDMYVFSYGDVKTEMLFKDWINLVDESQLEMCLWVFGMDDKKYTDEENKIYFMEERIFNYKRYWLSIYLKIISNLHIEHPEPIKTWINEHPNVIPLSGEEFNYKMKDLI